MNQAAASDDVDEECIKVIPLPPGYYQPNVGLPNLPPTYSPPLNHQPQPCVTDNNNTLPSVAGRPPSQVQLNQILLHSKVTAPPSPNRRRRRIVVALVIIFLISFIPSFWLGFRTAFH